MKSRLTVIEAATALRVAGSTVLKWIHSGELVASKFGGRAGYRIAEEDIDAFVKAKVVTGKKKHAQ